MSAPVQQQHPREVGHGTTTSAAAAGASTERTTLVTAASIVAFIVVLDQATKHLAVTHLVPRHFPHPVLGDVLRFTLTYNPGAAFGMHLGSASRWIFMVLTVVIVGFLARLYATTPAHERTLRLSVAAVMGGAIGNFIVAAMAVSVGAGFLVWSLWRYESRLHAEQQAAERAAHVGLPATPPAQDS